MVYGQALKPSLKIGVFLLMKQKRLKNLPVVQAHKLPGKKDVASSIAYDMMPFETQLFCPEPPGKQRSPAKVKVSFKKALSLCPLYCFFDIGSIRPGYSLSQTLFRDMKARSQAFMSDKQLL